MKFALIILLALAATLSCAPAAESPAPAQDGHRYLFLIDLSAGMARYREQTEKTIADLVGTGMNGEMNAGDAFVLWPYRDRVVTTFYAPATWVPPLRDQIARDTTEAMKSLKYEGTALFYVALVEAFKVAKASRAVTIFLISDGTEMLQGTEFDLYANTIYRDHATQARKEKKPFVTTLRALDGKVIGCTVGFGGDPVILPPIPAAEKARLDAEFAAARAAKAPAVVALAPRPAAGPPKTAAVPPQKTAPVPAAPKKQITTTPAPAPVPKTTPVEVPLPPPAAVTPTPTPAPAMVAVPTPLPEPKAVVEPPPAREPEIAVTPPPTPAAPKPHLAQVTPVAASSTRFLVVGLGLLVAAGLIIWWMIRRPRGQRRPSLISRGMGR